jgi:GTPase SAR1 family protein
MRLVVIYGLPGSGKSALANELAKKHQEIDYLDLAAHQRFREWSMIATFGDLVKSANPTFGVVTEGAMPNLRPRERFISAARETLGIEPSEVLVVQLDESVEVLSTRRNRTTEEYQLLREAQQVGSKRYMHLVASRLSVDLSTSILVQALWRFLSDGEVGLDDVDRPKIMEPHEKHQ